MRWALTSPERAGADLIALVAEVWQLPESALRLERERGAPVVIASGGASGGAGPGGAGASDAEVRVPVSLSRSHALAAVACVEPGEMCQLGIDVEDAHAFANSGTRPSEFAATVLGPGELDWYRETAGLSEPDRLQLLLRSWVRKEACVKAAHTGFDTARGGVDPRTVQVSPPWEPPECRWRPEICLYDLGDGSAQAVIAAATLHAAPHDGLAGTTKTTSPGEAGEPGAADG